MSQADRRSGVVCTVLGIEGPLARCPYRKSGELPNGSRPAPIKGSPSRERKRNDARRAGPQVAGGPVHRLRRALLPGFEEKHPKDDRPRKAVEARRAWVRGEIAMSEARAAVFAAHADARAAGHAAATARVPGHAASYAATAAVPIDSTAAVKERDWQYRRLPEHLRPIAFLARCDDWDRKDGSLTVVVPSYGRCASSSRSSGRP